MLSATQLKRIELELIRKERARRLPFRRFVAEVSPRYADVPPHLSQLYDVVEESAHHPVFVTVSMPPRHGKTETLTHALAWRIINSPGSQSLYATFSQSLAEHASNKVRKLVLRAGLGLDRGKLLDWSTPHGGGLLATSVGGSITGRGIKGGLAIFDDLLKGRLEAESKRIRDQTWAWMLDDAMSRLEGGASVIYPNTRWVTDDMIARLQKNGLGRQWRHINLPAIHKDFRPVDERETDDFEPLWYGIDSSNPTREGAIRWYAANRARGEYGWWSLYQGVPRALDSQIFRAPSFHEPCPLNGAVYIACDPAASANTKSDYTVVVAISVTGSGDTMTGKAIGAIRGQWDITDIPRRIFEFARQWPGAPIAVESVGAFRGIVGTLRAMDSRLRLIKIGARDERDGASRLNGYMPIVGDKVQRAAPVAAAWNAGRFTLPLGATWAEPIINEAIEFTGVGDEHDDCVDAIAHAWSFAQWDRARQVAGAQRGSIVDPAWG